MNFRPGSRDEPDINLIPFIDVLLVVLIFLVLSTTYSKYTELQVRLPTAEADPAQNRPSEVVVSVSADGRFAVNGAVLGASSVPALAEALAGAVKSNRDHALLIISADAAATHQAVVSVMDAARQTGLTQITFATQTGGAAGTPAAKRAP